MDFQRLLSRINRAFAEVPLPQVRVAPHHCAECDEIVRSLQGQPRERLPQAGVGVFGGQRLHLIAPEAVGYYFPNILGKALDPEEGDFLAEVLYFLSLSGEHTQGQVSLFGVAQREAVHQFLLYVQEHRRADVENCGQEEELTQALRNWTPADSPAA